ncbi:succinylglutamate desuccinylase/aspartoacylase family protein, partial [Streptomyces sp. NPDC006356]
MTLTIGPLRAEPGHKTRGTVPVDLGPTTVDIPLVLVNGSRPGPRVVITGGVHGGEFVGTDAAARLGGLLEPEEIAGQVVICPVANPPAVYDGRLGKSPLDGVNINRVFPGDPAGGPTERLAAWIFEHVISGADAYADLHSGGIDETLLDFVGYRLTSDEALDAKTRGMAHAVGYERVLFGRNAAGGNSHAAAARHGIPAILVETGQLGEREPAQTKTLLDGLYRLLHHLGVIEEPQHVAPVTARPREWVWTGSVESPGPGT